MAVVKFRPGRSGLRTGLALVEIGRNRGKFYEQAGLDAHLRLIREKGCQVEFESGRRTLPWRRGCASDAFPDRSSKTGPIGHGRLSCCRLAATIKIESTYS